MGLSSSRQQPQMPLDGSRMGASMGSPMGTPATPPNPQMPGQPDHPFYPRLHNLASNGGPWGGMLARVMMQGLDNRRVQQGISPDDWQQRMNALYRVPTPGTY